ncbi:MAG: hypothetical protein ABSF15_20050 [Candidatus Sulfotelmatobacter sp.]
MSVRWNGQFSCFDLVAKSDDCSRAIVTIGDVEIGGRRFRCHGRPLCSRVRAPVNADCGSCGRRGRTDSARRRLQTALLSLFFSRHGRLRRKLLRKAREATGLAIVTEVMSEEDVELIAEYVDLMQVGARRMENYALLQALGRCERPVLLKRGSDRHARRVTRSAQVIAMSGKPQIILCERGIRTFETATRNTPDIAAVPVLETVSRLPVIVDPSHAAGVRSLFPVLARAATVVGADGLTVEVHPFPDQPMSDGDQPLPFGQFRNMMVDLLPYLAIQEDTWRLRPQLLVAGGADLVTARPIVAGLFLLCRLGFSHTDFGLPPPPSPPFLHAIAKQGYLLAWMTGVDRFCSAAIIFFQASSGRHPSLLTFVASADTALCCDGPNLLFAGEGEARPRQILTAGLAGGEPRRASSCPEDCTRALHLPNDRLVYSLKTKRPVWDRSHGALDLVLTAL